ncbi:Protein boule [Orchesella cincta]|uniref:Protein boule n=1 Tax=Orchesella cincta TaxID=48709 RepID=A0A1D2M455_ORCCI|nr:Protein boule [Orchesella cincta]
MSTGPEMSPIAVEMNGNVSGGELTSKSSMESYTEDSASEAGSQPMSGGPITTSTPIDRSREGSEQPPNSSGDGFVSSAPKFGTLIPNRIFVGGISCQTTEDELMQLFSKFGAVRGTKIILDRAGVSKGYGFVTFETEEEAKRLCTSKVEKVATGQASKQASPIYYVEHVFLYVSFVTFSFFVNTDRGPIIHRDRRLNIAPAVKKQPVGRQDIPFSTQVDALSPPPPYDGTSVYFPQTAQATQFYAQPTPLPEPFFAQTAAFCPGPLPSTSLPSFYSSTTGPTSGPVCYLPQQFQQFPQIPCHNHWPTPPPAGAMNGNANVNGQCQWRWVSPDVTPTSPSIPPPSSFPAFMHHTCQNSNGQMHQPSFQHFLNPPTSTFPTPEQVFFLNSCVVPQPH